MAEEQDVSLDPGFIEDVGKHLMDEGTDDVNVLINKLQLRYQKIRTAENNVLQQRQRHQQKERYNKQTLEVIEMLLERKEAEKDTVLDYLLACALSFKLLTYRPRP
jgi:hypothetical protein